MEAGIEFTLPAGTQIAGGGYLVVERAPAAFRARFGIAALGPWIGKLKRAGERLRLRDGRGQLVDAVDYEAGFPWPTAPAGGGLPTESGFSAELINPALDRNLGGSWRSSRSPVRPVYIAEEDGSWHYRRGTSEASAPVTAWRRNDFAEDGAWAIGQTPIGHGNADNNTILMDMPGQYVSVFLRRVFTMPAGRGSSDLSLRLRVADGCIAWINGVEVARAKMNAGAFAFDAQNAPRAGAAGGTSVLPVTPAMLSGPFSFFASPSITEFKNPIPYGFANNVIDDGWIWPGDNSGRFTVDLGAPTTLQGFRVYSTYAGGGRGANWAIESSQDQVNWLLVTNFNFTTRLGGGKNDDDSARADYAGWYSCNFNADEAIAGRYWRVRQTAVLVNHAPRSGQIKFQGASDFATFVLTNASSYLVEGTNVLAIQVFNRNLASTALNIDAELSGAPGENSPTPGRRNSVFASNAQPAIQEVRNFPTQPTNGQPVVITAKISDPQGVANVTLSYQVVLPGSYIRKSDNGYTEAANWISLPMNDAGLNGDGAVNDGIYTATLPGSLQVHRRLVRYRIQASDAANPPMSVMVPYADDDSPNFAYFVYNGIPAWSGASKPLAPNQTPLIQFPESVMRSMPVFHLIANSTDVANSQFNMAFDGARIFGTLILDGKVYDHIQYYNHGANSTYASGKNKWRLRANRARKFAMRDDYGRPYSEEWDEFNLEGCLNPWGAVNRGIAGVDEAAALRAYQMAGVPAPNFNFLQFRIIDEAEEAPPNDQYGGDLWGLYLAKETPDGSFLDERGLPDGNVFRIEKNAANQKHQGATQPENGEDWTDFLANVLSRTADTAANLLWWRNNLNLPTYYSGRAIDRLVGNIDLREGANFYFYHHPDDHWHYVPWDVDLNFIPTLMNSGTIDQKNCLLMSPLKIEFANRAREILDLLGADPSPKGGQIGQLIDEYAQIVNPTGQTLTWADVDECVWNWNPRSAGDGSNGGFTSHKGNFYRSPFFDNRGGTTWTRVLANAVNGRGSHEAFVKLMTDYATDTFPAGHTWTINNGNPLGYGYEFVEQETRDTGVPNRPSLTYIGAPTFQANDLLVRSSAFSRNASGGVAFAAMQWRIGEISSPGIPLHDPAQPRIYEIQPVWTSPEITTFVQSTRIPFSAARLGHTYRARVRHKDVNGRWSRWSAAVEFVPSAPDVAVYTQNLVIAEIIYYPPGATAAEQAAGYSGEDFEYIQLLNVGDEPLDLTDVRFTKGINFDFSAGYTLAGRGSVYVARNPAAFVVRYGANKTVVGGYAPDNLSNDGERLKLSYGAGTAIYDFDFRVGAGWPALADGRRYGLQLISPALRPDPAAPASWRAVTRWPSWAAAHGVTNLTSDEDGDGLNDLMEYALGLDPKIAARSPALRAWLEDNYLHVEFRRQSGATDLRAVVEFSSDLITWTGDAVFVSSRDNPDGTATETHRNPVTMAGSYQFVRLRVSLE